MRPLRSQRLAGSYEVADALARNLSRCYESLGGDDLVELSRLACSMTERELSETGRLLRGGVDINAAVLREGHFDDRADGSEDRWPVVVTDDGSAYRVFEREEVPRRSFRRFGVERVDVDVVRGGAVWRARPGRQS